MHGGRRGLRLVAMALLAAAFAGCTSGVVPDAPRPQAAEADTTDGGTPLTLPVPSQSHPAAPTVPGVLTFRGNATRTYYGEGPVPSAPKVLRHFPEEPMCAESEEGGRFSRWCGTGWTGQPAVFEREGRTWVVFGAFDRAVHFLDADSGRRLRPDFPTGDIIKGSVTVDPDGFPLVYVGSRDNFLRVIAFDRSTPVELWRMDADHVTPSLWNDDWDGSPLVSDDYLFEGGENSQFHVVKLNRRYDANGRVTVDPQLVFNAPGWDEELLRQLGDANVSIEGSIALSGSIAYFANSGGLVQGWDVSGLKTGVAPRRVFRFWTGDDTDATVVVDGEGMLYVASQWQRQNARGRSVGQIVKLDPRRPNPVVWSVADQQGDRKGVAGVWATPALYRDLLIVPTNGGRLMGIDRRTGAVRWTKRLAEPLWQSPVVVDGTLIQGDCHGLLHGYDLSDTTVDPPEVWTRGVGGCVESTPVVWRGRIYVGTRAGYFLTLGD